MSLKKLNQFNYFDIEGFLENLKLLTIGMKPWKDYESGALKGTKVELVIAGDKHKYQTADGEVVSNIYEKLTVKVPKEIKVPMNSEVILVNPEGNIYGDFRNQLSIIADDIQIVGK